MNIPMQDILKIYIFPSIVFFLFISLDINKGLSFADEGFLWYGAWRTSLGEVPFIDFASYDPGRYYWVSAWLTIFGNDIITFRISTYFFALLGLLVTQYILIKKINNIYLSYFFLLLFIIWLFPHYKAFEHTVSILGIFFLYNTINKPGGLNMSLLGFFTAFVFFIGKNHALYAHLYIVLFFLIFAYKNYKYRIEDIHYGYLLKYFFLGYMLGLSPSIYMIFFVDGYLDAQLYWLQIFTERGMSTNLNKPLMLPWNIDYQNLNFMGFSRLCFSFFSLIYFFAIFYALFFIFKYATNKKVENFSLATSFVLLIYTHHFLSRPDINHLAQSVMPVLLLFTFVIFQHQKNYIKLSSVFLLLCISFYATFFKHGGWVQIKYPNAMQAINIKGQEIYVAKKQQLTYDFVTRKFLPLVKKSDPVLILPNMPMLYVLLDKKSPIYDIYPIKTRSKPYQLNMIENIRNNKVKWVLYAYHKYDGVESMLFENTFPYVDNYIRDKYEMVDEYRNISILKRL